MGPEERECRGMTLGQYLDKHGYSQGFRSNYVLPMCAAIWSVPNMQVRSRGGCLPACLPGPLLLGWPWAPHGARPAPPGPSSWEAQQAPPPLCPPGAAVPHPDAGPLLGQPPPAGPGAAPGLARGQGQEQGVRQGGDGRWGERSRPRPLLPHGLPQCRAAQGACRAPPPREAQRQAVRSGPAGPPAWPRLSAPCPARCTARAQSCRTCAPAPPSPA
jgi:hypothetical protein